MCSQGFAAAACVPGGGPSPAPTVVTPLSQAPLGCLCTSFGHRQTCSTGPLCQPLSVFPKLRPVATCVICLSTGNIGVVSNLQVSMWTLCSLSWTHPRGGVWGRWQLCVSYLRSLMVFNSGCTIL